MFLGYAVLALSGKIFCCRSCSKCGFDLFSFEKIIVEAFQQSSIMNLLMDCVCVREREKDRETEMRSEKDTKMRRDKRQKIIKLGVPNPQAKNCCWSPTC